MAEKYVISNGQLVLVDGKPIKVDFPSVIPPIVEKGIVLTGANAVFENVPKSPTSINIMTSGNFGSYRTSTFTWHKNGNNAIVLYATSNGNTQLLQMIADAFTYDESTKQLKCTSGQYGYSGNYNVCIAFDEN